MWPILKAVGIVQPQDFGIISQIWVNFATLPKHTRQFHKQIQDRDGGEVFRQQLGLVEVSGNLPKTYTA
jgi:hypothetical protein